MMEEKAYASLESQIGDAPCLVQDTPKMFYLRNQDDYESRVSLGNELSRQYRFKEAILAYNAALLLRTDEPLLYIRMGGALLTLGRFAEAQRHYEAALKRGKAEKEIAYYLGVWNYLQKKYETAAEWFQKGLPAEGEMKIALLYWHFLCRIRNGKKSELLVEYNPEENVGHHTAYKLAVSVLSDEMPFWEAVKMLGKYTDELDYVIAAYGLSYADGCSEQQRKRLLEQLSACKSVWPCISYLAAYYDKND